MSKMKDLISLAMTIALKIVVIMNLLGQKRGFRVLALDMVFQKHVNMALQKKGFA